jgi:hypothetical protein
MYTRKKTWTTIKPHRKPEGVLRRRSSFSGIRTFL